MALYARSPKYQPSQNNNFNMNNNSNNIATIKPTNNVKSQANKKEPYNPNAILFINHLLHQNQMQKISEAFVKLKNYYYKSNQRSSFMIMLLKSLFKRKNYDHLTTALSNIQTQSFSVLLEQKKAFNQRKAFLKQKALLILSSAFSKIQKNKAKNTFSEIRKKTIQKKLISNYRGTLLYASLNRIYQRKEKQGFLSLQVQTLKTDFKIKGLLKLNNFKAHREHQFKNRGMAMIRWIGAKRMQKLQKQQKLQDQKSISNSNVSNNNKMRSNKASPIPKATNIQNIYADQYKKLQIQLQSIQQNQDTIIQQYKNQIQSLQQKNDGLKFNYEYLQSDNSQLQRQIIQSQEKLRKKVSMKQVWQQIYKNLLYFVNKISKKDSFVSRQQLLQVMELPLANCNYNVDSLNQENEILRQLLQEYKKIGMYDDIEQPKEQNNNKIILSQYPFDVILKCNKYYYDVVDVLAQKGLGRTSQVDAFKQELENFIARAGNNNQNISN